MTALVDGIARLLSAAGVGAYDPDNPLPAGQTPITLGDMPPDGVEAITLTTYPGGPEPDSRNGWEYPRLQVRTRGASLLAALDLDRAIFDALQTPGAQDLPGGAWHLDDCYAINSEATPLGVDSNGRHEVSRNYQLDCWPI